MSMTGEQDRPPLSLLGIVRGNPGVFQLNPYPTPVKPLPLSRVRVLEGLGKGF